MICPLKRGRQYDSTGHCEERHCAWWDVKNSQCSVKTFLLNNTENPIQKLINETKEEYPWDQ